MRIIELKYKSVRTYTNQDGWVFRIGPGRLHAVLAVRNFSSPLRNIFPKNMQYAMFIVNYVDSQYRRFQHYSVLGEADLLPIESTNFRDRAKEFRSHCRLVNGLRGRDLPEDTQRILVSKNRMVDLDGKLAMWFRGEPDAVYARLGLVSHSKKQRRMPGPAMPEFAIDYTIPFHRVLWHPDIVQENDGSIRLHAASHTYIRETETVSRSDGLQPSDFTVEKPV